MSGWTDDELDKIGAADELRIAPQVKDGTLRRAVPIWVVRVGTDLYVRSYKGAGAAWYRGTRTRREGRIWAGGVERDVLFEDADPADAAVSDQIDAAYRAKYSRYGASYTNSMVSAQARAATIKLVPAIR